MNGPTFTPPSPNDSRSPCPALNALANHGILPRNGKNLTLHQLAAALRAGYNISTTLCYVLALSGLVTCGKFRFVGFKPTWTVDLDQLALHNHLEHDASLVHADAAPGARYAPRDVDPQLLHSFVAAAPSEGMDLNDFLQARVRRETELRKPLGFVRETMASAEAVAAFDRLSDPKTGRFSKDDLQAWFGQNRFPDEYTPGPVQGLRSLSTKSSKFRKQVNVELGAYTATVH